MASGAAGEFGKSAGKAAYESLRGLLAGRHGVNALPGPGVAEDSAKAALAKPEIAADPEVLTLAETLRAAIAALPDATLAAVPAIDYEIIRSKGSIVVDEAEGMRGKLLEADGDVRLTRITAPGKK